MTDATWTYPRPLLVRGAWSSLDGAAGFRYDDADVGLRERWYENSSMIDDTIQLPYPPESPQSSVHDPTFHPVLWYRIPVTAAALSEAGHQTDQRLLVHFGAVDYESDVWFNGVHVSRHQGGSVSFHVDVTDHLRQDGNELVVRAFDDPTDVTVPRGKQDWAARPHSIWYQRTSGIWRTVWIESVAPAHIGHLDWTTDIPAGHVQLELTMPVLPHDGSAEVTVFQDGRVVARTRQLIQEHRTRIVTPIRGLTNGQDLDNFLWSPDDPRLFDATVRILDTDDHVVDEVRSYFGLRRVAVSTDAFLLNDKPFYLRGVLSQGYWPSTHLAASPAQLEREVRLIKELGFNAVRVHQKVEDPRFLYWTDRLGLLVWAEQPSPYQFADDRVAVSLAEWADTVRAQRSHPSVIAWVPVNESWGVQHATSVPEQRALIAAYAALTRTLDRSRPVITNDGWEHLDSDLWTIHDYDLDAPRLQDRYADRARIDATLRGIGPFGHPMSLLPPEQILPQPVIVSECGGISYDTSTSTRPVWGYGRTHSADEFRHQLHSVVSAFRSSPALAGFFYTQLADTEQEANGLCDADRAPKLTPHTIRSIITGNRDKPGERTHWDASDGANPNHHEPATAPETLLAQRFPID